MASIGAETRTTVCQRRASAYPCAHHTNEEVRRTTGLFPTTAQRFRSPREPSFVLPMDWLPSLEANQNRERAKLKAFLIEDRRVTGLCNSLA